MPEPGEVKAARNRAGLTQQQLADILGVHVKTLRDYEKGKRARLRAGQAKLADFMAAHPEPPKTVPTPAPTAALRPLAEASDMELIAVLTARLALLRAAVEGPIPASVEVTPPTVVVQTVVTPAGAAAAATDTGPPAAVTQVMPFAQSAPAGGTSAGPVPGAAAAAPPNVAPPAPGQPAPAPAEPTSTNGVASHPTASGQVPAPPANPVNGA